MLHTHLIKIFLCVTPIIGFCTSLSPISKLEHAAKPLLKQNCAIVHSQRYQGNLLFREGKFKSAFHASLPLAECGDARAKLEVGFMYEFGKGVKQNAQQAALWYFTAIRLNQFNKKPFERGINAYFGNHQRAASMQKAARWFRMAAELSTDSY